jgi:hypothetical protein
MEAVNWGDEAYGALWGDCAVTEPGFYCDSNYVTGENSDASLAVGKWAGFFFGVGMAHQWPAVRQGGALPPRNRTVGIGYTAGGADSVRIVVTAPTGAETEFSCPSSPCPIAVDDRLGSHWYRVQYLNSSQTVLREAAPELLNLAPVIP